MPTQNQTNNDILYRSYSFSRDAINVENRTVNLSFMSEEPVERYFGDEILDVRAESVRLGRLNGGAAVLVDHNHRDHVGVVETVSLDADRVGRALVRFGKSKRAAEIFDDIQDGIRKHISVGYKIHRVRLEEERKDAPDLYRVIDFEPYELSVVSIPADATVGVGRAYDADAVIPFEIINKRSIEMPEALKTDTETPKPAAPSTPTIDVAAVRAEARKNETFRVREIHAIAERFGHVDGMKNEATKFIDDGRELDEFREYALGRVYKDVKPLNLDDSPADLGMSDNDVRDYSLFKAVRAAADKDWSKAGLEREVSMALAEQYGKEARGFFVPHDVMRDMSFVTAGQGKELVGTDHLAGSFIDMLRNKAALGSLGAKFMDGLVGNVDIPKQTGGASFYWIDNETTGTTESNLATGQVTMSPKTVSGRVDITRRLMLQSSPSAEALVRSDLIQGAALAIDLAGVNGTGVGGQPTGILNTAGIGSVAGGVDGLAPIWDHIVDLESAVSVANADIGSLSYLTNSKVRGKLKKTEMFAGTNGNPVWERGADPLNGYNAMATQQVPSNLTKGLSVGICSALLFGNFNDVIIGMWGGLDIKVDDITLGDQGGLVLRVFQDIDIAIRRAESFAAMLDALT